MTKTGIISYGLSFILFAIHFSNAQAPQGMVRIQGGKFRPFYKSKDDSSITVAPFYLDECAVTNQQFLQFVKANPKWAKSKVARLHADSNYLKHWKSDYILGPDSLVMENSPVVNVSWYAAEAYCKWRGKRLPFTPEWEFAAAADRAGRGKGDTLSLTAYILKWYEQPVLAILPDVKSTYKNKYGLWDMHGLIWEWVFDFNISPNGPVSAKALNPQDYACYVRYTFMQNLKANSTIRNLGFRCAESIK